MTESTETPWAHDTPGARALVAAYRDFYDEVNVTLFAWVARHPVLGPMVANMTDDVRQAQQEQSRERIERAFAGDWRAYANPLRLEGITYAKAGLAFGDWHDITGAWQRVMIPKVVARHAGEPTLLSETLLSMNELIEKAMAILASAYIEASEATLQARAKELAQWEAIFRHVAWGVVVVDEGSVIELANPAFGRLMGIDGEATGTSLRERFAPGELERVRSVVGDLAQRQGRVSYEAQFQRPDGTTFPAMVDVARLPPGAGSTERWAINLADLTEQRRVEALQRRSAELEEENRRVQEASRLKSEFLANMSHELRTPLNSIIGFAELLHLNQVGTLEARQHEFVGDILSSGRHLLRLISDVLDLSKVESGTMQFRPETTDIEAIAGEVAGVLRAIAGEKQVTLEVEVDPAVREVVLDPGRLKQVLYNYLSNAIKFSVSGGTVHLTVVPEGPISVRLAVRDHGPGIAPEDHHRLFVEFEQLDGGRAKTHAGTGLGLALTRKLVEAQGGTVGVESAIGDGATFWAVLPRRAPRVTLRQPRRIDGASAHAPRILVVEDDPKDQDRLVSTLLAAGFAVDTASTGAQARQACERHRYDAVTLDLLLPDCTGLEVLAAIRGTRAHQAVPVIVVSLISEQVTSGFVVHEALPKPIDEGSLLRSLSRAGISPPGVGPVLVVDDDPSSAKLMLETLRQLGYEGVVAHDGRAALELAERARPSAVILDLVMPELDGFAFLERFRQHARFAKVPVLVWTMRDLSDDEETTLRRGAQAVLQKDGGGVISLVETVRSHLSRAGTPSGGTPVAEATA